MLIETDRLILRKWKETDAESLFEYAKNPEVGPIAGWPPHKNIEESLNVIREVFNGKECYCICEKGSDKAIGAVELKLNGHSDMTEKDDECELGYWIGQPFWGRGYMPEAAGALIARGFRELNMTTIWCGYYDGNSKSKRVQEKLGFAFHHTCDEVDVPLLGEVRIGHTNYMTREMFTKSNIQYKKTTKADIELLMKVRLEMLREVNNLSDTYEYDKVMVDESRRYFGEGNQTTVLAFDGDEVVGCASLSYIWIMPTFSHPTGKRGHLMNVYTRADHRRMGISKKMVEILIDEAKEKGVTEISLDATEMGRPLYEALGFCASSSGMAMNL